MFDIVTGLIRHERQMPKSGFWNFVTFALRYLHRKTFKPDPLYCVFANRITYSPRWWSRLAGDWVGSVLSAGLTGLVWAWRVRASVCSSLASRTAGHLQICAKIIQPATGRSCVYPESAGEYQRRSRASFIWANTVCIHTTEVTICTKNDAVGHIVQSIYNIE